MRNIEIHAGFMLFQHFVMNSARDDIARSERAHGMIFPREFPALVIAQHRAFAAHSFSNQKIIGILAVERRWMELNIFHIN